MKGYRKNVRIEIKTNVENFPKKGQKYHTSNIVLLKSRLNQYLVPSDLISVEVNQDKPLNTYSVRYEKIENWQGKIAEIQEHYLRKTDQNNANSFADTLKELQAIIIAKKMSSPSRTEYINLLSFGAMNLLELFLLFQDKEVTEIFSNSIGNEIILSHLTHGRCKTNLKFTREFWNALKIRAELDSGRPLNSSNPAMKIGLSSFLGNLRISIQIEPLSTNGPTFNIRRLPATAISLSQLIEDNQITQKMGDYLIDSLSSRLNVIVAGEPGSGKTTLANALLQKIDKSWRTIVMEDAKEISLSPQEYPMLVQFSMPSVGTDNRYSERSNEISRLLHRSPDYVFLGEIQNQDDTKVTFEGFAAGIRGMATTHARNFEGLLTRWTQSHKLAEELVKTIDIVVITSKEIHEGNVKLGIQSIYKQEGGEFIAVY